jgi:porin-like protein
VDVIKEPMKKIVVALVFGLLPTWVAAQQSSQPPKHSPKSGTRHPVSSNPCAKYGVGFAKIAGSDTCLKIGGSVGVESGGGARR